MDIEGFLAVARGDAPADLLLTNTNIVNTFTARVEEANLAICQGHIAGIGDYHRGKEILDLNGKYVIPGLIDGHVHLESSHLSPSEYARVVVPRGISAVVTDLHEVANVCGMAGIEYMLRCAEGLPMDIFVMAPPCVPASHLETSGAQISVEDLIEMLKLRNVIGIGEVMDFKGVISGDPGMWAKIGAARGKVIDGHAPRVIGKNLNAYLSAGISSDHECTTLDEAQEKLSRGMYIMIREGSSEKNLDALLPLVTDETFQRCFFVVDDRHCSDLLRDGDIDAVVRKAINRGLNPIRAIQMATVNTARYFRLDKLGAVVPGYRANLAVLDDLEAIRPSLVFYDGRLVAEDGQLIIPLHSVSEARLTHTVNIRPFEKEALRMSPRGSKLPVIEIVPDQIVTRRREFAIRVRDGVVTPDLERDLLKLVVIERHRATGNIGLGLVKGFGLKRGAVASSIAHDSHNIVVVGTNDHDIFLAVKEIERSQGGIAVVAEGQILASLALPIAGLMSEEPLETVVQKLENLEHQTAALGCPLSAPFDTLSYLTLSVIPELRLTDLGMVDVLSSKLLS